jgi:Kef-type K+ transport system membrane component KefB
MGVALSITVFLVLVRILAELKLLKTDLGRVAGGNRALALLSSSMTGPLNHTAPA